MKIGIKIITNKIVRFLADARKDRVVQKEYGG